MTTQPISFMSTGEQLFERREAQSAFRLVSPRKTKISRFYTGRSKDTLKDNQFLQFLNGKKMIVDLPILKFRINRNNNEHVFSCKIQNKTRGRLGRNNHANNIKLISEPQRQKQAQFKRNIIWKIYQQKLEQKTIQSLKSPSDKFYNQKLSKSLNLEQKFTRKQVNFNKQTNFNFSKQSHFPTQTQITSVRLRQIFKSKPRQNLKKVSVIQELKVEKKQLANTQTGKEIINRRKFMSQPAEHITVLRVNNSRIEPWNFHHDDHLNDKQYSDNV